MLRSPVTLQHLTKVRHQSEIILKTVITRPGAKILSIGCGGSADLRLISNQLQGHPFEITLLDQDAGALDCSREKLGALGPHCRFLQGNIYKLARQMHEQYDLIVIGGVFDYFADKHIISLLGNFHKKNLVADGQIFFTNIAKGNPFRTWMEYCVDWVLIERTEEDIRGICRQAGLENQQVVIRKEENQLTYLVHILSRTV